jgi:hypothetical protein
MMIKRKVREFKNPLPAKARGIKGDPPAALQKDGGSSAQSP